MKKTFYHSFVAVSLAFLAQSPLMAQLASPQDDVFPGGQLGDFRLLAPVLTEDQQRRNLKKPRFFINKKRIGISSRIKLKKGSYCLEAHFKEVVGRRPIIIKDCSIKVRAGDTTDYLLSGLSFSAVHEHVDFGMRAVFRLNQKLALNPKGRDLYWLPAGDYHFTAELNSRHSESYPHRRRPASEHVLGDLRKTIKLAQGAVQHVQWQIPDRRRTVNFFAQDEVKFPIKGSWQLTFEMIDSNGQWHTEWLEFSPSKVYRFFPDADYRGLKLCTAGHWVCSSASKDFYEGSDEQSQFSFTADVINVHEFTDGNENGYVSITRRLRDDSMVTVSDDYLKPPFSIFLSKGEYNFEFLRKVSEDNFLEVGSEEVVIDPS